MLILVVMNHWNNVPREIENPLQADAATQSFRILRQYMELIAFETRRCP